MSNSNAINIDRLVSRFLRLMAIAAVANLPGAAVAANGTWSESTGDGAWSNTANWSGGAVADGANSTADFSAINLDAVAVNGSYPTFFRNAVQLTEARTIGNLVFGDANPSSPGGWQVYAGDPITHLLTLAGTTPTITVHPLGPIDTVSLGGTGEQAEVIDDVLFSNVNLAGTSGFTKAGAGILTLRGAANTITGPINLNQGTLRVNAPLPTAATINIADGATLSVGTSLNAVGDRIVNVAPGTTANIVVIASAELGRVVADNATLNVNITGTNTTFTPSGNWNLTGSPTAINVSSAAAGAIFRFGPNLGGGDAARNFNTNTFVGSTMTLNNVATVVRTNSTGNDINIGALIGNSTSALDGGGNLGGVSTARYHIGQLNTDTTFAGAIRNTSTGSILIDKVGTGTLTLSGNLTYSTTAIETPDQRGGVTRITAGRLKLEGTAAIPGGIADPTLGDLYTTIDVRAGATFDVTAASSYSTAPLQQLVGPGTVAGNYTHDEGRIRPADVPVGNSNIPTPTPGTMTFSNDLSFVGSGEIVYDMGLDPNAGTDRIQVNGTTNVAGSTTKVVPNFLTTIPTSGTYTILNSTGGITGSPSGWQVVWPGRGAPPTVVANGNSLQFTAVPVVGGGNLNWTGSSSNWDINTTQNWRNNGTNAADRYFNDDNVTFAETHSGGTPVSNFAVTIATNVAPRSVTVDSTSNYTFGGSGVITGTSTFTKRGSSTLTMQKANTFSGAATLEGGVVNVGNANGALGTGPLTISGTAINGTMNGLTNSSLTVGPGTNTITSNNATSLGVPALAGSGNLTIASADDNLRVDLAGAAQSFTGNVTFAPDGITGLAMTVRIAGAANDLPGAAVTLTNGATIANRNGSSALVPIELGALTGDAASGLVAFVGGGSSPGTIWTIGGRNQDTIFQGVIRDQTGGTGLSHVTKVGTGSLTLGGANTYTGNTAVDGGILSLSTAFLANGADVSIAAGAILNLNFSDTDTIDALTVGGVPAATGTWGSLASSAAHKSDRITGSGMLLVSSMVAPSLIGDYNNNGVVDAADYTIWRNNNGTNFALQNRDPNNTGNVSQADYTAWKTRFGNVATPGAGSLGDSQPVPEPTALVLAALLLLPLAARFRTRTR